MIPHFIVTFHKHWSIDSSSAISNSAISIRAISNSGTLNSTMYFWAKMSTIQGLAVVKNVNFNHDLDMIFGNIWTQTAHCVLGD